jgi:Fe-S oxidoreductase/nitrate reductase gamma subunit
MVESAFRIEHFLFVEDLKLLLYTVVLVAAVALALGFYSYYRRWTYGGERLRISSLSLGLARFLVYGVLQRRVLLRPYEGVMHLLIFTGFLVLLAATILRFLEADVLLPLAGTRFLTGMVYAVYKLAANIGGILLLAGTLMAWVRRILGLKPGLPDSVEDHAILALFVWLVVSGFLLDGIATLAYRYPFIGVWDPVGTAIASLLAGWRYEDLVAVYRTIWVLHMLTAIAAIAALPYTKLSHIVFGGLLNTLLSRPEAPAAFRPVPDIEERVEAGKPVGVVRLADTTWKQRLDYDACTRCSRCQDVCPAFQTGKPLSPMNLVLAMRRAMDEAKWDQMVVPGTVRPEEVWSCVTCGACVYTCPVLVHHVETVIDLRRGLVSRGELVPEELLQVAYNIMKTGNPYAANPYEKEEWLRSLIGRGLVEEAREGVEHDYLLWVGCAVAYDPRLRGTVEALLQLLKKAGIRVAVALEQNCCGEPARRIGDELLFVELVKRNAEILKRYRFRKLLVTCPHGYNVFRNEYPLYGVKVDVEHHVQLLARLIAEGRLKPRRKLSLRATYHDPCYLGRWNGVLEEPRLVARTVVEELVEMRRSRLNSFCCGGGGGGAFYDIKVGERISKVRAREAKETGAKLVVVACPFCNTMLSAEAPDYDLEVKDVAELVKEAME